ncbi:MAG: hypothetical protein L0Z50_13285 [Verrucomicrobiales bacterium]|nr:hypothetical protein [Verrucomicrobiales bacterium]
MADVAVANGIASTAIPVNPEWFRDSTHLGIAINGAAELLPRVLITAVPMAMYFRGPRIEVEGSSNLAILFNDAADPNGNWTLQTEAFQNGHFGIIRRDPVPQLVKSFVISPQGNVGIGTLPNLPDIKLDVLGAVQATRLELRGPNLAVHFLESLDVGNTWSLQTEAFQNGSFGFVRRVAGGFGDPNLSFIITSAGNVGVGTPLPTEKLHVNGNVRVRGEVRAMGIFCDGPSSVCTDNTPVSDNSYIRGLMVENLFVKNIINWNGLTVCVPRLASEASTLNSVRARVRVSPGAGDAAMEAIQDLTQKVETESASLRSVLKAKDAELEALREAVAELKKAVNRLTPQTK